MSVESHDLGPVPNLTALSGYGDSYVVPGDEVYVVSEDTDYIYLNTGTNPPADGFNIIKAIFLPGVWQRRSSGGGAGALRYNTIAVGALGSGRLIDASLAGLVDGTSLAWVESVKDTWRWDATSTLTADNITVCNPTANGVNPGRFIRELIPAPEWMFQTTWVIDAANSTVLASDENDGTSATTPLLTDTERQRRMGLIGQANQSAYHFRYISTVPVAQQVLIRVDPNSGSNIFVHGSMTDGQGLSTIFTGTSDTITAENYAAPGGGQPWEMICAGIPVSWTASGCVDKRLRWTSGANIQRILWITKDLGGAAPNAKARLSEPQVFSAFTAPYAVSINTYTPAAGDTFVIENLVLIPNFQLEVLGGGTISSRTAIILDSIEIGTGGSYQPNVSGRDIVEWGCSINRTNSVVIPVSRIMCGCQFSANSSFVAYQASINNCYQSSLTGALTFTVLDSGSLTRHMQQGNAVLRLSSVTLGDLQTIASQAAKGWLINQLGVFDVNVGNWPLHIVNAARLSATSTLWGSGNITNFAPIVFYRGARLTYAANSAALPVSYFYLQPASAGLDNGAFIEVSGNAGTVTAFVPAYDAGVTNLFTANRLLSPANLQATVAAGGFGGRFFDPVTTCSMGEA